jgi:hypothetical protein
VKVSQETDSGLRKGVNCMIRIFCGMQNMKSSSASQPRFSKRGPCNDAPSDNGMVIRLGDAAATADSGCGIRGAGMRK